MYAVYMLILYDCHIISNIFFWDCSVFAVTTLTLLSAVIYLIIVLISSH